MSRLGLRLGQGLKLGFGLGLGLGLGLGVDHFLEISVRVLRKNTREIGAGSDLTLMVRLGRGQG